MVSPLPLFSFLRLLFLLVIFHFIVINTSSSIQPLCHENESSALMQFKQGISIRKSASKDPLAYPKVASWKPEVADSSSSDCCSWDGITCHGNTGHVIGLDLSSSLLYGTINSSSSLFHLVHLRRLNLADNDFNHSQISSAFGFLSRLSYLNLSFSLFGGQIPSDLSYNNFEGQISSKFGNLTKLTYLDLSHNNFMGQIPSTFGNLTQLTYLDLSNNYFTGQIPSTFSKLTEITHLSLEFNNFSGENLSSLGKLTKLLDLFLYVNNFNCEIPSFANLTQLDSLNMHSTQLIGQIPSWLMNLTQLTLLDLTQNMLQGPIPESISQLVNLETLGLGVNNLSGRMKLDVFLSMKNLIVLSLSGNQLTLLSINSNYTNATFPKYSHLALGSCKLTEFPDFLRYQDGLIYLDLQNNRIGGLIPKWIWNISTETLEYMIMGRNFLTGFDQPPSVFPQSRLGILSLDSNMLQGSLPIPPSSIHLYGVSHNKLIGDIPPLICNLSSLVAIELSYNNLNGIIPQCLGSFSNSLSLLNVQSNNLHGPIPQKYNNGSRLKMIALSQNQLQGPMPRSLVNCKLLEILDLGNNQINDTFPFWLGTHLPELKVLILRYNRFHGAIPKHTSESISAFPKLCVIDLSHNGFTGKLPSDYFHTSKAMTSSDVNQSSYMHTTISVLYFLHGYNILESYNYTMTLTNKGMQTIFSKIPDIFTAIDLSSNQFNGEISESIGILKGLIMLNLSNNNLIGHIPSSLGNLTELESLDLSQNKLSGEIPQQLTQLTFLAIFDVSHNHLTGPIPRGRQFDTFETSSYEENSGLCGDPLSKKCGNLEASPPPPSKFKQDDAADDSWFPLDKNHWIVICMGYGGGLVVGLIVGHTLTTRYHEWFISTFGRNQKNQRRKRKSG